MSNAMTPTNNMNVFDVETLSKYYCNKESLREKHQRSYLNRIEMDEIMTYAYSSDENDYINQSPNLKDSDDDSLGISCVHLFVDSIRRLFLPVCLFICRFIYTHF